MIRRSLAITLTLCLVSTVVHRADADGKVVPPRDYKGSLEERAQEAIIIFHGSDEPKKAREDLILKIHVEGDATQFAWVIPFPNEPDIEVEDPKLFRELFNYVEARTRRSHGAKTGSANDAAPKSEQKGDDEPVQVLSRQIVGDYDTAVVRENREGGLNPWLKENGFQSLDNADDVLEFYRKKNYVFACIKVSSEALATKAVVESHPLRFSFDTGGRDGIYFPMKMTGLQSEPFDVNLYVFYRYWINDKLSRYGYRHRGFTLRYRDYDTKECVANGGKAYSLPEEDPFLDSMARRIPTVTKLFQKLHPGEKYYLTNIRASGLKPEDIRAWSDDLWLFPYYTNREMIPYDARRGGPAAAAYPQGESESQSRSHGPPWFAIPLFAAIMFLSLLLFVFVTFRRRGFRLRRKWEQRDFNEISTDPSKKTAS